MTTPFIGYAARLEQFAPAEAVALAVLAEQHGFDGTVANDRFQPRVPAQGEASFAWSVLGALGAQTTGGIGAITTPGYRMHPAVVAQASATLAALFPGRHWLAIGSGEAINEHVVGQYWPEAPERIARMFEAIDVIKKLFASGVAGRDVKHAGPYFSLESARLWTMPATPPPLFVATSGPVTAKRAGKTVDGIVTVEAPDERLDALFRRFDEGCREAGRPPGTKVLQVAVSWAETDEQAARNALAEGADAALRFPTADIRSPFDFAQMARMVRVDDFVGNVFISSDPDAHRAHLQRFADLGVDRIHVHNVGRNQREFIEVYGRDVLPKVVR
ncbi:TIGR03557 family F420-dependent LLM class oxidoreductase [Agromyces atrinae]|uniref:G6PDH family F420-dependent oxidoreductase n=1 Tax=Agromyces atrinae TaxID=592376 RepID=A0A4Q2MF78_9MICO|nr:TIGR03557 family F420-dependent LLM class oxidoreductase [Agromyces atrinae]MCI2956570.1 TIGR03557 family F420-dependent LLM class oxidoreductase [Agromyces atrinae]NYD68049.1 G6PDH family F420-dependent oxidoreductase [Agromyces atrinae]RXZ87800.1 TIGR03557 family F420-dependent LLM class oxidoreductase [Agromyces atrinae]